MVTKIEFQNLFVNALYTELLERAVNYFLPQCRLEVLEPTPPSQVELKFDHKGEGVLELEWLGSRCSLSSQRKPFTENERKLLKSIGNVCRLKLPSYLLTLFTFLAMTSFLAILND